MIFPVSFYRVEEPVVRKITFTMATTPSSFTVKSAFLKYDKDFLFGLSLHDGWLDAYNVAFRYFTGSGAIIHNDGVSPASSGLYFTDGCGNDVAFRGSCAIETEAIGVVSNMSWPMVAELYSEGWYMTNHSLSGKLTADFPSEDPERTAAVRAEIQGAIDEMRAEIGANMRSFNAPSADDIYELVDHEFLTAGVFDFIYANYEDGSGFSKKGHERTLEEWINGGNFGVRTDFTVVSDPVMTRTDDDLDFFRDEIAEVDPTATPATHKGFKIGIHRVSYGEAETGFATSVRWLTFKDFFDRVEAEWGKSGSDNMWFVSWEEFVQYTLTRLNTTYDIQIDGTTVTVTFDFSGVNPLFREHAVSLLIDSDTTINSISYSGFPTNSHSIASRTGSDGGTYDALVNVAYRPEYDKAVTNRVTGQVLVSRAEVTKTQEDVDTAQAFLDTLAAGSFNSALQTRLDAIVVTPESRVISIDFGSSAVGSPTPAPWNNMTGTTSATPTATTISDLLDSTSNATGIGLEVTTQFSLVQGNTKANASHVNNPFPYTALRDSWETTPSGFGVWKLTGLNSSKRYDFIFCSSRGFTDQDTLYTVTGSTTVSDYHLTKNNGDGDVYDTAVVTGIAPDTNGDISVRVEGSVGLTPNSSHQGFMGAVQITERNP